MSAILAALAALSFQAAETGSNLPLIESSLTVAPVAQTASSADQVADSAANANSDRVSCRQEVKPNSRFTRRVCRKAKDWNQTAEAAQADLGAVQMRNNSQQGEFPVLPGS
ncbi:MAG TPA: hypothetical protein VEA79_05945 [Phenylobacterium sp.]|nr:hypothetical protein [Phenylobacterium sp.]